MTEYERLKEVRKSLSKLQGMLFKCIGDIESVKLLLIDSEGPCEAPCIPICCDDCHFGKVGDTLGMLDND